MGDISSRFGSVRAIQQTLTTAAIEALLDGLMAIAALVMMLLYSVALTGVVLAAVAIYGLVRWISYRPLRDAAAERLVLAAKENTHFLETLRAITPLKLFGRDGSENFGQRTRCRVVNRRVEKTSGFLREIVAAPFNTNIM